MTDKTTLGDRMKQYELTSQSFVLRRTPVIIRIDGRAFHTFTSALDKLDDSLQRTPFSEKLHNAMLTTACILFNEVQNCVLAYTQSDEISLVLRDWDRLETQQWFGGNLQKIVSLSASIATAAFNYGYGRFVLPHHGNGWQGLATFDSRAYNLPKEEVTNYFIWRQQDASRNSVQMLGRFHFSQKQMHGKNNSEVQDMLMLQKQVNWNDLPTWMKRGSCVVQRPDWNHFMSFHPANVDDEIPIFTQDRQYIEKQLEVPEEDLKSRTTTVNLEDYVQNKNGFGDENGIA